MKRSSFGLCVAILAMSVVLAAWAGNVPSIGIDIGDGVWDDPGEDNATGLQITATSFGKIGVGGGEKSVTVDGITFTLNPGGAEVVGAWADYSNLNDDGSGTRYTAAVPWKLEGLTPGALYNLAFLSIDASQKGKFTVTVVGTATPDDDGDGNFEEIPADGSGMIEGTWDVWAPNTWTTFTALLVEQVPPPAGTVITIR